MYYKHKRIRGDNLMLFNECVQKSGGIMSVTDSYIDLEDGTLYVGVRYSKLTKEFEIEYQKRRRKRE